MWLCLRTWMNWCLCIVTIWIRSEFFSANNSEVEFCVDNLFSLLSRRLFLVGKITRRREHLFLIKQQASSPHWIGSWKSFQDDICFQILVYIWNSFMYQNRVTITTFFHYHVKSLSLPVSNHYFASDHWKYPEIAFELRNLIWGSDNLKSIQKSL